MKIFSYRYLPLNLYFAYTSFVCVNLVLAPIEYKGIDYWVLIPYLACLMLLFSIGFIQGARGPLRDSISEVSNFVSGRYSSYLRVRRPLSILLVFGVIGVVAQSYVFLSAGGEISLLSIGEKYVQFYEDYERGQANVDLAYVIAIIGQALSIIMILFGIYYYRCIARVERIAVIVIVASYLVINVIGGGRQKSLGDIVIYLAFFAMISFAAQGRRIRLSTVLASVGAVGVVVVMFVEILKQRYVALGIGLGNMAEKAHPLMSYDETSAIFDIFGSEYGYAISVFLGYFTNGLYGLYLSLTLPFEWTFFVGNSYSLGRIVEIIIVDNGFVLERTYPYRVGEEYGWDISKWHSLYAWLASDITFLGVCILTPAISFLYGRVWVGAVSACNAFSGPLFMYLSLGLIFSFANNQIMHSLAGVIVLVVLVFGWLLHEKWLKPK